MITYYTECGCVLNDAGVVQKRVQTKRGRYRYWVCKKHGGKAIRRTNNCRKCGVVIECALQGCVRAVCDTCQRAYQVAFNAARRADRAAAAMAAENQRMKENSSDCLHFGPGKLCGRVCIRPHFRCRMYDPGKSQEAAA